MRGPSVLILLAACTPVENDTCDPKFTDLAGDGNDQDCDGVDGVDADGDGFASVPSGGPDCDDDDGGVNPDAADACNGVDDDCSGVADDGPGSSTFHRDADGDGAGLDGDTIVACEAPDGFVAAGGDCDDARAVVSPARTEACNGWDDDCDGIVDDAGPGEAPEWHADADGDGLGDPGVLAEACTSPSGAVLDASDCDDARADVGAARQWYPDADGDGFGGAPAGGPTCAAAAGEVPEGGDCDDGDDAVRPGAVEVCGAADDDCDGLVDDADPGVVAPAWFADTDGDGFGDPGVATRACAAPGGHVAAGTDCDDALPSVFPGAAEVASDGVDQDCDGADDADFDRDGFTAPADCDDLDPNLSPTASDVRGDFIDQNCDGIDGTDWDGDGFASYSLGGGEDCDDFHETAFPGNREILADGFSNECEGPYPGPVDQLDFRDVDATFSGYRSGVAGDFDGDGDLDVVTEGGDVFEDSPVGAGNVPVRDLGSYDLPVFVPDLDGNGDPEAGFYDRGLNQTSVWLDAVRGPRDLWFDGTGIVADLDADGVADLVTLEDSRYVRVTLGPIGTGRIDTSSAPASELDLGPDHQFESVRVGDANGDGLGDLLVGSETEGFLVAYGPLAASYGRRVDFDLRIDRPVATAGTPILLDLDGDGADEILYRVDLRVLWWPGDVPGAFAEADAVEVEQTGYGWTGPHLFPASDRTGDDRADLWMCDDSSNSACYLVEASALAVAATDFEELVAGEVLGRAVQEATDVNGDGQPELLFVTNGDQLQLRYSPW